MNGAGKKSIEYAVVATLASILSVAGTYVASRENKAAHEQAVEDRVAALEKVVASTAASLQLHEQSADSNFQMLSKVRGDLRTLKTRQEWAIRSLVAIGKKNGVYFDPPPDVLDSIDP